MSGIWARGPAVRAGGGLTSTHVGAWEGTWPGSWPRSLLWASRGPSQLVSLEGMFWKEWVGQEQPLGAASRWVTWDCGSLGTCTPAKVLSGDAASAGAESSFLTAAVLIRPGVRSP